MKATVHSKLPRFVVLGQGKAGTTLIYRVLKDNPAIGLSDRKELHFFSAHYDKGPDWYASHFDNVSPDAQLPGEISPSYLSPEAVQRIFDTLGAGTKIIFVLRRPIEQAYSRYLQNICADQRPGAFFKFDRSLPKRLENLHQAIKLAYKLFGAQNVLPLFFERDIACDDPTFEPQILNFLGQPDANFARPYIEGQPVNPGIMPRYLYSGDTPLEVQVDAKRYVLPPRHLVFCGQIRNSWVKIDADAADVADALARQSSWTSAVTTLEYRNMLKRAVLPAAKQLEQEFGFNLAHWRCNPRHIAYDPAPPPSKFLQNAQ